MADAAGVDLSWDALVWLLTPHKLWRRTFLDAQDLRFPEGRRRLEDKRPGQHCRQQKFAAVECPENQAADAETDLERDARGAELERHFDERNCRHHAQPHEDHRDGDSRCRTHGQQPTTAVES